MRCLFTLTYYHPYVSGLSLYVKRLVDNLPKNIETSVLCINHANLPEFEDNIVRAKPSIKINKGFLSFDWIVKFWQMAKQNDIVFINLPQFEGFLAAAMSRVLNKKTVSIYHCDIVVPNSFIQLSINISTLLTLVLSDKIISYTKDYATHSKFLCHFLYKVDYVYPPIPETSRIKTRKAKKFTIGVAARLAEEKGIEYLLEGVRNLDCRVLIAGPTGPVGEEKYKNKIMKLVSSLGDKIKFLGTIDPEFMNEFYSKLDVLVLPSTNSTESFGMVQVEAMVCGVPVIASDLPGVRVPIQRTGLGILVPPKNTPAIIKALSEIKKIKRNNFDVKKEFSLGKTINFYEKFIKNY